LPDHLIFLVTEGMLEFILEFCGGTFEKFLRNLKEFFVPVLIDEFWGLEVRRIRLGIEWLFK
jgi:hypothetical protein